MHKRLINTLLNSFLLLTICHASYAQEWSKEELSIVDHTYMQQQHDSINELTSRYFGRQLTGEQTNDFALMQRLLDEKLVKPEQKELLQAMGVIFGNIFKKKHGLTWIIYLDQYGRSRALNISKRREVIFPITMISRRVGAGAIVDINDIDRKAEASLNFLEKRL